MSEDNNEVIDQEIVEQSVQGEVDASVVSDQDIKNPSEENEGDIASTTESDNEDAPTVDGLEIPQPDIEEAPSDNPEALKRERQAWAERRIREKELKLKREAERQRLEKEQEALIELQSQTAVAQLAATTPHRDDFADEQEYTEAMVSHTLAKREIKSQVETQARQQLEQRQKFTQEIENTVSKGAEKYSDFEEVVEPLFRRGNGVPTNVPLVDALNESKFGPDILYMLGKNKAKAVEIASMTPVKAIKWVWETERKFEEARAKKNVNGGIKVMQKVSSKLNPTKDVSNMSNKEYKEYWHKKQYGN